MKKNHSNLFSKSIFILHKTEDVIIVSLLSSMLGLAVFQIILRNFFQSGIQWGEPFLRILVLWLGLIGAMIASRNDRHINIDLLSKYLPEKIATFNKIFCRAFTAVICAIVSYYSFVFVLLEKESGDMAFSNIPLWVCESIIPISFAVISLRYILMSFLNKD